MPNENTLALEKPEPVAVPDIGKPLTEVFKAGGMPLAFLFILATIIGWLLTRGFAEQALSTVLLILKWMLEVDAGRKFHVIHRSGYSRISQVVRRNEIST